MSKCLTLFYAEMYVDEHKSTLQRGEGEYPSNEIFVRCLGTSTGAPGKSIFVESGSGVSRGSDVAIATPSRKNHMARVQHLDIRQKDLYSSDTTRWVSFITRCCCLLGVVYLSCLR